VDAAVEKNYEKRKTRPGSPEKQKKDQKKPKVSKRPPAKKNVTTNPSKPLAHKKSRKNMPHPAKNSEKKKIKNKTLPTVPAKREIKKKKKKTKKKKPPPLNQGQKKNH